MIEAYIDPGSGSLILQMVAGGLAAAGVALRLYWKRIKTIFSRGNAGE